MAIASMHNVWMSTCFQIFIPELRVDHFDGDPRIWMKCYSIFPATIDRAPIISSEKMIDLQSLLTGEAKDLVGGYGCNGDLYASALHRLQEHFGNPKRIVNAFLENLIRFKSPNLTHPEGCILLFFSFGNCGHLSATEFIHDLHSTTNL